MTETSEEIYAHLNTIRYITEESAKEARKKIDNSLKAVISHPAIKKKLDWESNKFASRNPELQRDELFSDAVRILFSTIQKEWKRSKDPKQAISWCCARIGWRLATYVGKEVQLERTTDEDGRGVYSRPDKSELTEELSASLEYKPSQNKKFGLVADLIRDANIDPKYKHPLTYVIILGCNFKDLARYYRCTPPTASNIYKKSLAAFKDYVAQMSPDESEAIFETIKEILDG